MFYLSIPLKLILSLILGAVIGLERESYAQKLTPSKNYHSGSLGVRSFALITVLGTIAGLVKADYYSLFLIVTITFMALLLAYYIVGSFFTNDNGITTELAIIYSFLIGLFIALEVMPIQLILAITVVLILILSKKENIQTLIAGIKSSEFNAFVSYALIALVVLPFLPNVPYSLKDIPYLTNILAAYNLHLGNLATVEIFNPFNLWKIVAIITGVELFGYMLEKTFGQKKGWLLTSMAGGFISSTSTTQSIAQESKTSKNINLLVSAAFFANLASFFQHFILIASINTLFLAKNTVFILAIIISATALSVFYLRKKDPTAPTGLKEVKSQLSEDKIFSLSSALKFTFIFLLVKIFTKISLQIFGSSGFLITSTIAALTGIDAVTINASELAGNLISYQTGLITLVLANAVNLLSKSVYTFMSGNKQFALKFTIGSIIIILSSTVGILAVL
jgi:uncharacterized membrane protein (DUF4010 family)